MSSFHALLAPTPSDVKAHAIYFALPHALVLDPTKRANESADNARETRQCASIP